MLTIREDRVRKAAKRCPDAREVLEELFPEAFEMEFYSGAKFKDPNGNQFLVVHSPDYDRRYFLANMETGYLCKGIEFHREGTQYKLTLDQGKLDGLMLVHKGYRR